MAESNATRLYLLAAQHFTGEVRNAVDEAPVDQAHVHAHGVLGLFKSKAW